MIYTDFKNSEIEHIFYFLISPFFLFSSLLIFWSRIFILLSSHLRSLSLEHCSHHPVFTFAPVSVQILCSGDRVISLKRKWYRVSSSATSFQGPPVPLRIRPCLSRVACKVSLAWPLLRSLPPALTAVFVASSFQPHWSLSVPQTGQAQSSCGASASVFLLAWNVLPSALCVARPCLSFESLR